MFLPMTARLKAVKMGMWRTAEDLIEKTNRMNKQTGNKAHLLMQLCLISTSTSAPLHASGV